ncbi:MAG: ferredoxin--NADP reductase [Acidobacteriaceae bacterium]
MNTERRLYTARLIAKHLLSERTQCSHLTFEIPELDHFEFMAGQFISTVVERTLRDGRVKQETRAYSLASAPQGNRFDLCLNRVEDGFFSNRLSDLEIGATVQFDGPHGDFVLREPLGDSIFIATGTGIAPIRSFVQQLFPESGEDKSQGKNLWLVYGTRHETEIYYRHYFERIAAEHPNFRYLPTLSRPHEGWEGLRGYVQEHAQKIVQEHPAVKTAYICGLNAMVSATRTTLKSLGWDRKQIVFERYD